MIAIQLNLDTPGLTFTKWGATQRASAGDWLVENEGEVYTVEREVFARTYRRVGPGQYLKVTPVWAEQATEDGQVQTLEGVSHYRAGDYVVSNDPQGQDSWAVSRELFERRYALDE